MAIDMETRIRFGSRNKRSEENDRRVLQFRVSLDLRCDFASIPVGHDYIKEDQIRPKIPGGLMSPGRVVLFEDQIAARLLEKDLDQMSGVFVVIDNQNPPRGIAD